MNWSPLICLYLLALCATCFAQKQVLQDQDQEPQEEDSFGDDPATTLAPACEASKYQCEGTTTCLNYTWRCDDIEDCPNQDDERNCESSTCPEDTHWRCPSTGRCIRASWKCDGDLDCDNGEDEKNCIKNNCADDWFQCASGSCISPNFICDGDLDCPDGDDETREMCVNRCTAAGGFFLCSKSTPLRCLPGPWECDGDRDCGEGEDEANCTARPGTSTTAAPLAADPTKGPNGAKGNNIKGYIGKNKRFKYGYINNRNKF